MSKTELWDRLGKTDPSHTKQFKRAGGFSGTAIKPMWAYKRMTEEFGPCGKGWGVGEPSFQVVPGPEGEMLVYCTASAWYIAADESGPHTVFGVGGDKVIAKFSSGIRSDDEAFKKAFTDAITNALKMIGVGADVHMGMFDDNKYVNSLRDEFEGKKQEEPKAQQKQTSAAAMKRGLEDMQRDLLDCRSSPDFLRCVDIWKNLMDRDGWTKDYRDEAKKRFEQRRADIKAEMEEREAIQGEGIRDTTGRELSTMEAY